MDLTILFISLSVLGIAVTTYLKIEKGNSLSKLTALLLGIILLGYSNSAIALTTTNVTTFGAMAAKDSAVSADNKQFEDKLKVTPSGNHYSGLEYPEEMGSDVQAIDDNSLTNTIQSYSGDDIVVGVASGSVRLSGTVNNKKAAQDLVEKIKGVPGVREITFDLGYGG